MEFDQKLKTQWNASIQRSRLLQNTRNFKRISLPFVSGVNTIIPVAAAQAKAPGTHHFRIFHSLTVVFHHFPLFCFDHAVQIYFGVMKWNGARSSNSILFCARKALRGKPRNNKAKNEAKLCVCVFVQSHWVCGKTESFLLLIFPSFPVCFSSRLIFFSSCVYMKMKLQQKEQSGIEMWDAEPHLRDLFSTSRFLICKKWYKSWR